MEKSNKKRKGITILEMLVAITIFTMGIAGFSLLFIRVWQGNKYTLEMGQSSMAVSQAVNKAVEYIRGARQGTNGAYPVILADDNELTLYADYDGDGTIERIHFYKSGQDILMGVRDPVGGAYADGDGSAETIAQRIVNTASQPIFYYYDNSYYGGTGQTFLTTPAAVSSVRLVKIHLYINIDPNRAPDNIEMQTFVELRNLNDYNNAS